MYLELTEGLLQHTVQRVFYSIRSPQVAGLQQFAKFLAGESVTPRGGSTQQTVILTSLPRRGIEPRTL